MVRRKSPPKRRSRAHDKHVLDNQLGQRMFFRGVALHGDLTELQWRSLLIEATEAMGMTPVASAAAWQYPLHGAGGTGYTIIQPISESFLVVDTWPDHDGAYLFVCSCKSFDPRAITKVVKTFGLKVGDAMGAPDMLRLA